MSNNRRITSNTCSETNGDCTERDGLPVKVDSNSIVGQRMTIAGVFFDIALFVADVEHMKFIIDSGKESIDNYHLLLGLLIGSLSLQLLVGVLLFISGFSKHSDEPKEGTDWTKIMDNIIVGLVSLIALINILVTIFGDRTESVAHFCTTHNCTK